MDLIVYVVKVDGAPAFTLEVASSAEISRLARPRMPWVGHFLARQMALAARAAF